MKNEFLISWDSFEQQNPPPIYKRNVHELDFSQFKKDVFSQKKDLREIVIPSLYKGDVYLLKKAFDELEMEQLISKVHEFGLKTKSEYCQILEETPNFHRVIDEEVGAKYSVLSYRHCYYFFPWNHDPLALFDFTRERWRLFNFFSGMESMTFEKNTPKSGVVNRIHITQYPPGIGFVETHQDNPKALGQKVVTFCIMTKRGKDYQSGGLYLVDEKERQVDMEDLLDVGDMVMFYPTLKHGVATIDPHLPTDWNSPQGRWLLAFNSPQSNYHTKRETSSAVNHSHTSSPY